MTFKQWLKQRVASRLPAQFSEAERESLAKTIVDGAFGRFQVSGRLPHEWEAWLSPDVAIKYQFDAEAHALAAGRQDMVAA